MARLGVSRRTIHERNPGLRCLFRCVIDDTVGCRRRRLAVRSSDAKMKFLRLFLAGLLAYTGAAGAATADPTQISIAVGKLLQLEHYSKHPLDDEISQRFLDTYLKSLDYSKLFFTQEDVDKFEQAHGRSLDEDVMLGNLRPAYEIFDIYVKRVEERVGKAKELLAKEKFNFKSDRQLDLNRDKLPWPKNEAAAAALWRDRIENELLQARLSPGKTEGTPKEIIQRRYDRLLKSTHEMDRDAVLKLFLNALALTYDPHSEYLSQSDLENFSINMKLSLFGIGAVLRSEDGYTQIMELIPGGPAAVGGELKVNDKVVGVAQGSSSFVDVIDMKLDKVVDQIRGAKGSTVRLQVIPATAADPSERKVIEIVRDEVKLTEQEAKAELVESKTPDGKFQKLGWITLPSFYQDMEHRTRTSKSTTRDVRTLINRLNKEGVDGLVIDLRRNGGGSLDEAINLSGLFIKEGAVVQVKNAAGRVAVYRDDNPDVAYEGPMIVLVGKQSASASEIFAAAMQDYGRALIVGDKNSFGKGTVQKIYEIGPIISSSAVEPPGAGALKVTIQKFYRVAGGATQIKGVAADLVLPSRLDALEIGESSLDGALPYDEVKSREIEAWPGKFAHLDELLARSGARVAAAKDFLYIAEDTARLKETVAKNKISLNEKRRREEIDAAKKRTEERKAERAARKTEFPNTWEITLKTANEPELKKVSFEKKKENDEAEGNDGEDIESAETTLDPVRQETLGILGDMIDLNRKPRMASVDAEAAPLE